MALSNLQKGLGPDDMVCRQ